MNALVRDLLPYGVVVRLGTKRQRAREAARLRERVRMLRSTDDHSTIAPALPRLNMGCGTHHEPGWINADAADNAPVRLRLTHGEPLPFETNSLEVVFSEHFLEHLTFTDARWFLVEAFRVLQPGGLFRVSCPDLDVIVRALTDRHVFDRLRDAYRVIGDGDLASPEEVVNHAFYGHEHRHLWTFRSLTRELERVGFTDIHRAAFGASRVEGAAIDVRRGEAFCSVIAEARKPNERR